MGSTRVRHRYAPRVAQGNNRVMPAEPAVKAVATITVEAFGAVPMPTGNRVHVPPRRTAEFHKAATRLSNGPVTRAIGPVAFTAERSASLFRAQLRQYAADNGLTISFRRDLKGVTHDEYGIAWNDQTHVTYRLARPAASPVTDTSSVTVTHKPVEYIEPASRGQQVLGRNY